MRFFLCILFTLSTLFVGAQEMLSPLLTNKELIQKESTLRSIDQNYIYAIDTIHLPFRDDFSTDLFKKYNATPNDTNVTDSIYYSIIIGSTPDADTAAYMEDTTYRLEITIITPDSVSVDSIPLPSITITHCDLDVYPVSCVTKTVWPATTIIDSMQTPANPDIVQFIQPADITQDSAQVYFVSATDTASLWVDNYAYLNNSYAVNPPTIGVVTFDGLNENGYPYDFSTAFTYGKADYLTSKPIYLGTDETNFPYGIADSIYLSFYYQAQGLGNQPESEDSLVVQFWSPITMQWSSVWSVPGEGLDTNFKQVMIPIKDNNYLANGFQFRFVNYASLSGSFDHWNIDYVYLEESRFRADTIQDDVAFTKPVHTLLKQYTAMPWNHYKWDIDGFVLDTLVVHQKNLSNTGKLMSDNNLEVYYNSTLSQTINNPNTPSINAFTSYTTAYDLIGNSFVFDTTVNDTSAVFAVRIRHRTTPDRCRLNDTLSFNQVFEDYYSYDDGTAEVAYGVQGIGGINPKIASKFNLIQPDTLKSVRIHFSPSAYDQSSSPFILSVWKEGSGGKPGALLHENISFSLPKYNIGVNGFYEYKLDSNVYIPAGNYFVGWQQTNANVINVGYDLNRNGNLETFYNTNGAWANSGLDGTLMIHPAFAYKKDYITSIETVNLVDNLVLFPNPTNEYIYIKFEENDPISYKIMDLNGKIIDQNTYTSAGINLSSYQNGIYLMEVTNLTTQFKTIKKVIKN